MWVVWIGMKDMFKCCLELRNLLLVTAERSREPEGHAAIVAGTPPSSVCLQSCRAHPSISLRKDETGAMKRGSSSRYPHGWSVAEHVIIFTGQLRYAHRYDAITRGHFEIYSIHLNTESVST